MVSVPHAFKSPNPIPLDATAWLQQLQTRLSPEALIQVGHALRVAQDCYGEHLHPITHQPLINHALGCAQTVDQLRLDGDALCAALLFAAPNFVASWQLALQDFGPDVIHLLDNLSKVTQLPLLADHSNDPKLAARQIEIMRKMLLAMVEDIRVVIIKLAWRAQTMHGLKFAEPSVQQRVARETMDLFAPLANRLGIGQIKWELEDLSFRFLEPDRYQRIAKLLDEKRGQRETYIQEVLATLTTELHLAGITAEMSGRPKHIYSIWKKMHKKRLEFHALYDIRAIRILVETERDCYTVLGIIHHLWQPIPGQFDDYISHPKHNLYRSLHTAVTGPQDRGMEVQIRTHEMHQHAEMGVAAHWRYKEGKANTASDTFDQKIAWLRELLNWRDEISGDPSQDDSTRAEQYKNEIFQDTVYVLSPQGRVIDLPAGASPIDFAYTIHTDLGHRCRGAKINGHIVPLSYALQNGDRVEILAAKTGGPSLDWLRDGMLKSSRAIAKVRQWIKQQHHDVVIEEGRQQFEKIRHKAGHIEIDLDAFAQRLNYKRIEDLYAALGRDEIGPKFLGAALSNSPTTLTAPAPITAADLIRNGKSDTHGDGILVAGVDNLLTALAHCCHPIPDDEIVGYVTQGRGISIHRRHCMTLGRLSSKQTSRIIPAAWGDIKQHTFAVNIAMEAIDRPGLLRDISETLARDKINITAVHTQSKNGLAYQRFTIELRNRAQLTDLLTQLHNVPGISKAWRRTE